MKYRIKQTAKDKFIVEINLKGIGFITSKQEFKTLQESKDWIAEQEVNYPIIHDVK